MYQLNTSTVSDEEGDSLITYGITYKERVIKDISLNKDKIESLITLCNKLNLSPMHLDDVIEDFLVDFEI